MTQHHFNQAPDNEEKRRNVVAAGLPIQSEILGDSAKLEELFNACYQQHEAAVRSYLRKRHSGLTAEDIDDVTMMVFAELYRDRAKMAALLSRDEVLPWLFERAKYRAIDVVRKKMQIQQADLNGNLPQVPPPPPDEVQFRQHCTAVDLLLEHYPSRNRRIVVLSYFPKLSESAVKKYERPLTPEEVAQECRCSPGVVRMVLYRFRIDVRSILENDPGIQ